LKQQASPHCWYLPTNLHGVISQKKEISELKVIKETLWSSKKHFSTLKLITKSKCFTASMTGILLIEMLCNSDDDVWSQTMLKLWTLSTFVG